MPPSGWPSKVQLPASGLSKPVRRLKKVVLPAPFGPMRAVIRPRGISTWATSTAATPPNVRRTPSATTIASSFGTPGRGSSATIRSRTSCVSGKEGLPSLADQPLRPEDHDQHQGHPHDDEPDRALLDGTDRQPPVRDREGEQSVGERQHHPEDDGAD